MSELHIPDNEHYRELKQFIEENRNTPGPLIQVLHKAQEIFGYLPKEVQQFVAQEMDIPFSRVYGVVTFYNFFRTEPVGKHLISFCLGTACHVKGAQGVLEKLADAMGIEIGGTTDDRIFTLSTARCFGACGLAPAMMIDEEVYGRLTADTAYKAVQEFKENFCN